MRLLKLGIYHETYLRNFYAARTELKSQPYDVQHRALIDDCFGSSDFWTSELEKLNYETTDIIANAKDLQKTWAKENDSMFVEGDWLFQIAAAQIKLFRPDVLLVADYSTFTADFLRTIRRECPSVKLILGWCGAPYRELSVMREWDIALSCVPEMVEGFRSQGIESEHINHAFAERILVAIDLKTPPDVDFAFIGSIVKQNKFHNERERFLLHLLRHTNLEIWADLDFSPAKPTRRSRLKNKLREIITDLPGGLGRKAATELSTVESELKTEAAGRAHSPVFGLEMFQKLRDSRIIFNNHIDISPVSASNMRLFETTGVGACLLTESKKNLSDLFEPDSEVVTYSSVEECIEKVRYLLDNENERRTIAEAGQRRTLCDHTFANRAARIDEIIRLRLTPVI